MDTTTTQNGQQQVVTTEPQRAPLAVQKQPKIGAIVPTSVEQAFRMATAIVRGGMAPKAFDNNPEAVLVAIMHGMEVGLTPMAAVQSIAVINGFPTIWGDGALGLVRASGLLEDMVEQIESGNGEVRAVCTLKRRGQPTPITRTFSISDAQRAHLTKKPGPWLQYPQRMLQMRARSWALRDGFADVLRGLRVMEEVIDMTDEPMPSRRPTRDEVDAQHARVTDVKVDSAEMDRQFRQALGGSGLDTDPPEDEPMDEGPRDHPAPEPPPSSAFEVMLERVDGKPQFVKFAQDCVRVIGYQPTLERLDGFKAKHEKLFKAMPPSLADKIHEALAKRREALED